MKPTVDLVEEFHILFGVPYRTSPIPALPANPALREGPRGRIPSRLANYAGRMGAISHDLHTRAKDLAAERGEGDPEVRFLMRLHLLQEELSELATGFAEGDPIGMLDALTDLQYVLDGTYVELGMQGIKEAAFTEVHRSNLSKLGADGTPLRDEAGRVLKGPNYSPPNLEVLL